MITKNVSLVMTRIKKGTPASPISVFMVDTEAGRCFDVRFSNTVDAQRMQREMTTPAPNAKKAPEPVHEWIGDFTWQMNNKTVRSFLFAALEKKVKKEQENV